MTKYRPADFIHENIAPILQAWEDFARTIEPQALTMDDAELRDHAHQMLLAFAADLAQPQSDAERFAKISREIVHAHGGRIDVASTAAAGTTFTMTLPRRQCA